MLIQHRWNISTIFILENNGGDNICSLHDFLRVINSFFGRGWGDNGEVYIHRVTYRINYNIFNYFIKLKTKFGRGEEAIIWHRSKNSSLQVWPYSDLLDDDVFRTKPSFWLDVHFLSYLRKFGYETEHIYLFKLSSVLPFPSEWFIPAQLKIKLLIKISTSTYISTLLCHESSIENDSRTTHDVSVGDIVKRRSTSGCPSCRNGRNEDEIGTILDCNMTLVNLFLGLISPFGNFWNDDRINFPPNTLHITHSQLYFSIFSRYTLLEIYKTPTNPPPAPQFTQYSHRTNSQCNSLCSPSSLLVSLPPPHPLPTMGLVILVRVSDLASPPSTDILSLHIGTPLCCATTGDAQTSSVVKTAATLLGVDLTGITGLVGLTCNPITVMHVDPNMLPLFSLLTNVFYNSGVGSGANCAQQPVCCTGTEFKGLVNLLIFIKFQNEFSYITIIGQRWLHSHFSLNSQPFVLPHVLRRLMML